MLNKRYYYLLWLSVILGGAACAQQNVFNAPQNSSNDTVTASTEKVFSAKLLDPVEQADLFCLPESHDNSANSIQNCFSCFPGQSIVFKNGLPVDCTPYSQTDTEKISFQTTSVGETGTIQSYVSRINNACSSPLSGP